MTDIHAVKQRADIVAVIGQYVPLQRAGRTFKACCPFHQEKTPSFVVNPDRQTWHCFGACSTGGDVFQFLMRRENLTFGEALRQLARQVGVELAGGDAPREDHTRLIAANEAAAQYFHHLLRTAEAAAAARAYVERRGVDQPTLEAFQLGYALNSFDAVREHLTGRGFSVEELVQAGLLTESERGTPYDRFRDRLIFPIRDERGRVIGFGGRVLGDGLPKYLNSPQTAIFDKSGTLYALDKAKDAVRAAGSAVVVEGYMDVIAAHQFGIRNVVATLGTALTERHVQLLKRYTKRVTLAMDADAAGIEAAMRGEAVVRRAGAEDPDAPAEAVVDWSGMVRLHAVSPVEVRVFTVPQGKDPDEAIRADPAGFAALAEQAVPPFEFRLRHELARVDRTNPRAMIDLADRLLPVLAGVSDRALQARYLAQLATATGAREDDLRARLRDGSVRVAQAAPLPLRERVAAAPAAMDAADEVKTPAPAVRRPPSAVARQEALCLRLLYNFSSLRRDGMLLEEDLFTDAANRMLFQAWRGSPDLTTASSLFETLDPVLAAQLRAILQERMPPYDEPTAAKALADVVGRMRLHRLEERKRLLAATLHEAETGADGEALARLALEDLELGMQFHQREAALRTRSAPAGS